MKPEVVNEIIKFAMERYGKDVNWYKKVFGLSKESIARKYFQEFVNWEDYRKTDEKELNYR